MHSNGTLPLTLPLDMPLDAQCGYSLRFREFSTHPNPCVGDETNPNVLTKSSWML